MFVLVALLGDAPALVAAGVAVGLQHVGPGHLAVGVALAPRGLLVAAGWNQRGGHNMHLRKLLLGNDSGC